MSERVRVLQVSSGVQLKPWSASHVETMVTTIRDNAQHIHQFLNWPDADYNQDHARAFIRRAQANWRRERILSWGIWEGQELLGGIGMNHVDAPNRSTYLGYWLTSQAQGRGLMTKAVRRVTTELFYHHGYHRVVLAIRPDNERSRAIAERLRFREEGLQRGAVFHHGAFGDG